MIRDRLAEALCQLVGDAEDAGLPIEELAPELEEQAAAMRPCVEE
jgi:hypothetical protein